MFLDDYIERETPSTRPPYYTDTSGSLASTPCASSTSAWPRIAAKSMCCNMAADNSSKADTANTVCVGSFDNNTSSTRTFSGTRKTVSYTHLTLPTKA